MDTLVSVAQVLSALELALMVVATAEAGGVQMIRVEPMMLSCKVGVCSDQMFVTFSVTFVVIGNCIEETNCLQLWN